MKIKMRLLDPSDVPLITATWLRTYRSNSRWIVRIMEGCYFNEHNSLIKKALINSRTIVACDPSDPEHIIGYLVGVNRKKADYLHYIYVKQIFRRHGVAGELLNEFIKNDDCYNSHETLPSSLFAMLRKKYKRLIYNPYPFFNPEFFNEVQNES